MICFFELGIKVNFFRILRKDEACWQTVISPCCAHAILYTLNSFEGFLTLVVRIESLFVTSNVPFIKVGR